MSGTPLYFSLLCLYRALGRRGKPCPSLLVWLGCSIVHRTTASCPSVATSDYTSIGGHANKAWQSSWLCFKAHLSGSASHCWVMSHEKSNVGCVKVFECQGTKSSLQSWTEQVSEHSPFRYSTSWNGNDTPVIFL